MFKKATRSLFAKADTEAQSVFTQAKAVWDGAARQFNRLVKGAVLALGLAAATTGAAYAVSPGCAYINGGGLDYKGTFLVANLRTVIGAFEPGDQIFVDYARTPAISGILVSLVALGGVNLDARLTDANGKASLYALIGQLLPINVTVVIADLGVIPLPNIDLKVRCTPAPAPSTLSLTSAANPTVFGQTATFTATVAAGTGGAGTPTGNVTFTVNGISQPTSVPLSNGIATFSTATLGVGNHTVLADYAGSPTFRPASAALAAGQNVEQASTGTIVTSSTASTTYGSSVTLTATTTPTAPGAGAITGTTTFRVDNVDIGTAPVVNGVASFTTTALAAGTNRVVQASFGGNTQFKVSDGTLAGGITIAKASSTTTLSQTATATTVGQPVTFRATVSGAGATPTGAVTFSIDNIARSPVTLVNGIAELTVSDLSIGPHAVTARYGGGPNHLLSDGVLPANHQVNAITTTLSLTQPVPIVFGQSSTVTATLTPASGIPTGTVEFTVDGSVRPAVTLTGTSASIVLSGLGAGTHTISARYVAIAPHGESSAAAVTLVVSKAPSTVTLTQGGPYLFGQSATVTADVSAAGGPATGQVSFSVDNNPPTTVSLIAGKASLTLPGLSATTHTIVATYLESSNALTSTTTASLIIGKVAPLITVESSANPAVFGQPISYTARVTSTAGLPTGEVEFTVDGTVLPRVTLTNGAASVVSPALAIKTATVTAHYLGNTSFLDVTGTLAAGQKVDKAATTPSIASATNPLEFGTAATFTATVAATAPGQGVPTGTLTFSVDGVPQAPTTLNAQGTASLTRSDLAAGPHIITANYAGDDNFRLSSGAFAGGFSVTRATTTTTVAIAPATLNHGDTATITATVRSDNGPASGSASISFGGVDYPVALVNGVGTLVLPAQALGSYALSASYAETANFAASASATTTIGVGKGASTIVLSAAPTSIKLGETIALSARVTANLGTPSGAVEFFANGVSLGSGQLSAGLATLSTAALPRGVVTITATYAGNATYLGNTATLAGDVTVTAGTSTMSLGAAPNPTTYGETAVVTATLGGPVLPPSGIVTFTVNGVASPVTITSGRADLTLPLLPPGSYPISASYAGSADHLPVTATLPSGFLVTKATTSIALSSGPTGTNFGEALVVTAKVTSTAGQPEGQVKFAVDGVARPDIDLVAGEAVITLSGLPARSHTITASYNGNALYLGSVGSLGTSYVVQAATANLAVSASPNPAPFGTSITVSAAFDSTAGLPTGDVVFYIGNARQAPATIQNGVATLVTSGLPVGNHAVRAEFAAQGNFAEVIATLDGGITIGVAPSMTTLTGPTGQVQVGDTVVYRAVVNSGPLVPTGSVRFTVDGTQSGPITLVNGAAEYSVTMTRAGTHTISANYSGSDSFMPSSASLTSGQAVTGADSTTELTVPETAEYGAPIATSVTITVSSAVGTPTGMVTVRVDGTPVGTTSLVNGVGTVALRTLAVGEHTITASYGGEINILPSIASSKEVIITKAATTVTATLEQPQIYLGQTTKVNIDVRTAYGPANGDVTVTVGSQAAIPTSVVDGKASVTITGTIAGAAEVVIAFTANNNYLADNATVSLTVLPTPEVITIVPNLPRGIVGEPYTGQISAFGGLGGYEYEATLPTGLAIDPDTGAITGAVSTANTYDISVTVTDQVGSPTPPVTKDFTIRFVARPTIALTSDLPAVTHGASFVGSVTASNGTAPYTYTVSAGALPPQFTLNPSTGAIAGSANQSGTFNFTVTARDAEGFSAALPSTVIVTDPTIAINGTFASAQVGVPYAVTVNATGSIGNYTYSVGGVGLPAGLSLNGGTISGTPTAAGSFSFDLVAKDQFGFTGTRTIPLLIAPADIVVTPEALRPARQNQAYQQVLTAVGGTGDITFSASGNLPNGMSLNSATNTLEGTPTQSGTYDFTITATDTAALTGTRTYRLVVVAAASIVIDTTLPAATAWETYTATIAASSGVSPYVFTQIGGSLPLGITLSTDGTLTGKAEVTGSFVFTVEVRDANGDSVTVGLTLRVNPPVIGVVADIPSVNFGESFSGTITASGGSGTYTFRNASTVLNDSLLIDANTGVVSGNADQAGEFVILVEAKDANGFIGTIPVPVRVTAPTINVTGTLSNAIIGQSYSEQVGATGGSGVYRFTVTDGALPAGLTLNAVTGEIAGEGTAIARANFVITATDQTGGFTGSAPYSIDISSSIGSAVLPLSIPPATSGVLYEFPLASSSGTFTYALSNSALPPGFAVNPLTGDFSGVTLVAGDYAFTLTATDAAGRTNTQIYTLRVLDPTITPVPLAAAVAGTAYSQAIAATGPTAPFTFTLLADNLPEGMTFDADLGTVTGAPKEAGSFSLSVTVSDNNGFTAPLVYAITVAPPTIALSYTLPLGRIGSEYAGTPVISGGLTPYAYSATGLPDGLTIDGTSGMITGSPTAAATSRVTLTATDANGFAATVTQDLVIASNIGSAVFPETLTNGTVGTIYADSFAATNGGPGLVYSVVPGLPAGLVFDPDSGAISGTPTAAGQFSFTVTATDANSLINTQTFEMIVDPRAIGLPTTLSPGEVEVLYEQQITPTGGNGSFTYALADAPAGITINADGLISGTPTVAGIYNLILSVSDTAGATAAQRISLTIAPATIVLDLQDNLPGGTRTVAYSAQLTAENATGSVAYVLVGTLPAGLTLSANGLLSGTPNESGTFNFTITAADAEGHAGFQLYDLEIAEPPPLSTSSISVTAPQNSMVGQSVTVDLVVSATSGAVPVGTVELRDGNSALLGSATLNPAGTASFTLSFDTIGNRQLTVSYLGSATIEQSTSAPVSLDVTPANMAVSLAFAADPVQPGEAMSMVATVTRIGPPTSPAGPGTITLRDNGSVIATRVVSNGVADFTEILAPGLHNLSVEFTPGTANDTAQSVSRLLTVRGLSATAVQVPTEPVTLGGTAQYVVTVSGAIDGPVPTGSVSFFDGGTLIDTIALSGTTATLDTDVTTLGAHSITATYLGDTVYEASTSAAASFTVIPATGEQVQTTTVVSTNPAIVHVGETVSVTALVSGDNVQPTGFVRFENSAQVQLARVPLGSDGTATASLSFADTQTTVITAFYEGDDFAAASSGPLTVTPLAASPDVAITSSTGPDGSVIVTVTVTAPTGLTREPTGTVTLSSTPGGGLGAIALTDGTAVFTLASGTVYGQVVLTATYSGDIAYASDTATLALDLPPQQVPVTTSTSLNASTTTPYPGQAVTLIAQVQGAGGVPTGTVQFRDENNTDLGSATLNSSGLASIVFTPSDIGTTTITAHYIGNANWVTSENNVVLTTAKIVGTTTVAINGNADGSITVTVTVNQPTGVNQTPTGTITLSFGGTPQTTPLTGGVASFTIPAGTIVGPVTITASYSGDTSYDPDTTSLPFDGGKAGAVLTGTVVDYVPQTSVNLRAVVTALGNTPEPTGNITFTLPGQAPLVMALENGVALAQLVRPTSASVATMAYSGDANYEALTTTIAVQPAPDELMVTDIVLEASATQVLPGGSITLTATVLADEPVLDGTVEFYRDGQSIGIEAVDSGVAELVTTNSAAGTRRFTARYHGDVDFMPSDSNSVAVFVGNGAPPLGGRLTLTMSSDRQALFAEGQIIGLTLIVGAIDASAENLVLTSDQFAIACPSGTLAIGTTMTCTASYRVTSQDMARGSVQLSATAEAPDMDAASASVQLMGQADVVSDTFKTLSEQYLTTRARLLGSSIEVRNIFDRRRGPSGSRAGTVEAMGDGNSQTLAFASSLAEWRNWAAARATEGMALAQNDDPLPIDIWIDAQMAIHARTEDGGHWGSFATIAAGVDYLVTEDFLAGIMVQGDWTSDESDMSSMSGSGFLVGPYVSIALGETLSFEATLLYGRAFDTATATILGESFSGQFDSTRLYAKGALEGHFDIDALIVRPNLTFFIGSESASGYTVTNASGDVVTVAGTDLLQYRVTVGGKVEYIIDMDDGAVLTPLAGLDLGFTGASVTGGEQTFSALGALTLGFEYKTPNGFSLGTEIGAEIAGDGFSALRAKATISGKF